MMSNKEDNITWALERCRNLLKSQDISPKVVDIEWDNALMNVVDTIFPKDTALLCEFHINKNVKEKCKPDCKVKDLKVKDGKNIKSKDVAKNVMDVWAAIVGYDTYHTYLDNCNQYKIVPSKFFKFLEYVETTFWDR